jgi:hypothetical protein
MKDFNLQPRTQSWLFLLAMVWACDRPAEQVPSLPESATRGQATLAAADAPIERGAFQLPAAARVVAIGDLHGDLDVTRAAFRLAGAIDEAGTWIGGALVVVQTGDQVDRGDADLRIIEFLTNISNQAKQAGGAVHVLNGNHEAMNVLGDFRYVTPAALLGLEGLMPHSPQAVHIAEPYQGRAQAFLPGGALALVLAERPLILMIGASLFVHGGVLPAHLKYGIDRLNSESAEWMKGKRATPPSPVLDPDGPLWTRAYGGAVLSSSVCKVLSQVLQRVGAQRMVIGHTVQERGMNAACDEQVYRIDVGLSHYYGGRSVQVLEIDENGARVLQAPR